MRSRIYEGVVLHRRLAPRNHSFLYRVGYPLLDLDEIEEVTSLHPLWSFGKGNLISYHRGDYLDGGHGNLSEDIRNLVESRLGIRPGGRIMLLAQLRSVGWLFNPLAVYYCWNGENSRVEAVVLEVTNTPWHERHQYVLQGTGWHTIPKEFHVSPFFRMDQTYRIHVTEPGQHLVVKLESFEGEHRVFHAALALREHEVSRHSMSQYLIRHAFQPLAISLGIYLEAFRLYRKRIPFIPHPAHQRSM